MVAAAAAAAAARKVPAPIAAVAGLKDSLDQAGVERLAARAFESVEYDGVQYAPVYAWDKKCVEHWKSAGNVDEKGAKAARQTAMEVLQVATYVCAKPLGAVLLSGSERSCGCVAKCHNSCIWSCVRNRARAYAATQGQSFSWWKAGAAFRDTFAS